MSGRLRRLVGLLALLVLTGPLLSAAAPPANTPAEGGFVRRSGTELVVDGRPFRFVGFNLYDAAASDLYSCLPSLRLDDDALDEAMRQIREAGGTVVRFWAFQTYTDGGRDFAGVDRVIAAARAHGLRVLPVLEDGQGNCSTGPSSLPLDELDSAGAGGWYVDGYRVPLGTAAMSYRDYAARVTRHYRDEPAIVAWSLLNEAESPDRAPDGRSVLVAFADDVADVVHTVDPHHLVMLGTQSNGAHGASGRDFRDIYALPGMDLTEVHDWGFWGDDTAPMPGAGPDGALPDTADCAALDPREADVACSFAFARALGKPLVVGEAGIRAGSEQSRQRRAEQLGAKIDAAFGAGAAGYLVWQLNNADTDDYGVLIGSDDPLFEVLREAAAAWASP